VQKCCRAGQTTDDIRKMQAHCMLNNYGYIHTYTLFHCKNGCANTPQFYAIRTFPALFLLPIYFRPVSRPWSPCFIHQACQYFVFRNLATCFLTSPSHLFLNILAGLHAFLNSVLGSNVEHSYYFSANCNLLPRTYFTRSLSLYSL